MEVEGVVFEEMERYFEKVQEGRLKGYMSLIKDNRKHIKELEKTLNISPSQSTSQDPELDAESAQDYDQIPASTVHLKNLNSDVSQLIEYHRNMETGLQADFDDVAQKCKHLSENLEFPYYEKVKGFLEEMESVLKQFNFGGNEIDPAKQKEISRLSESLVWLRQYSKDPVVQNKYVFPGSNTEFIGDLDKASNAVDESKNYLAELSQCIEVRSEIPPEKVSSKKIDDDLNKLERDVSGFNKEVERGQRRLEKAVTKAHTKPNEEKNDIDWENVNYPPSLEQYVAVQKNLSALKEKLEDLQKNSPVGKEVQQKEVSIFPLMVGVLLFAMIVAIFKSS